MGNRTISIMLASAAVMAPVLAGCSDAGHDRHAALASDTTPSLPPRIEKALAKKDFATALTLAEQIVTAEPRNGDYRALLGRAYLANGRYLSARTAFADAMTLGNRQPRTIVSLALCETGVGNAAGARSLLATYGDTLPVGDYGLAMTIAGNPQEGVRALVRAAQLPDANATTRQNLAYALAMSGMWGQARLVAGQDLSSREAEARIGQWAWQVLEGRERDRVVAMVGVAPRPDDSGLPTRLALDLSTPTDQPQAQVASAADGAGNDDNIVQQIGGTASAPAVARTSERLAAAVAEASASPTQEAVSAAFRNAAPVTPAARPVAQPAPRPAMEAAFARPAALQKASLGLSGNGARSALIQPAVMTGRSDWVVQLGAYDSEMVARERWQDISVRHALTAFQPVNSVVAVNGRTFYRLAVRGFDSRASAVAACAALKDSGQGCFVRLDDKGAGRMAQAELRKIAFAAR